MATFYELLGVPNDADVTQMRDAYRHLARVIHPDTAGTNNGDMALLNEAWHTLSDPGRRASYDSSLRIRSRPVTPSVVAPDPDRDDDFFEFHRSGHPRRWPAAALMLTAAMAFIFVFTAYAVSGGRGRIEPQSVEPLVEGTCVVIRPGASAVAASCHRPHYGMVKAVTARGERCLPGTEGYFDRNSDAQVCVKVGGGS